MSFTPKEHIRKESTQSCATMLSSSFRQLKLWIYVYTPISVEFIRNTNNEMLNKQNQPSIVSSHNCIDFIPSSVFSFDMLEDRRSCRACVNLFYRDDTI